MKIRNDADLNVSYAGTTADADASLAISAGTAGTGNITITGPVGVTAYADNDAGSTATDASASADLSLSAANDITVNIRSGILQTVTNTCLGCEVDNYIRFGLINRLRELFHFLK